MPAVHEHIVIDNRARGTGGANRVVSIVPLSGLEDITQKIFDSTVDVVGAIEGTDHPGPGQRIRGLGHRCMRAGVASRSWPVEEVSSRIPVVRVDPFTFAPLGDYITV